MLAVTGAQTIAWGVVFVACAAAQSLPVVTPHPSQNDLDLAAHLERHYSYGRSPPVFPSPQTSGKGGWQEAYDRARVLVASMTNDEKNNLTYCHNTATNGCSAMSGAVPRLGFPGMCLQDNGNSIRDTDGVNGYPAALHIGASWNRDLAFENYVHLGAEFKRKGANVALGPVAGVLGKVATGGRNWEGFSNDPYLSGALTRQSVLGLQKNVVAAVKHFVGNEQETSRYPPRTFTVGALNQSLSSNVDDKTMHEVYMWPFQDAIHAGVGGVMCSYNQLNGSYGCQNSKALNGLVKGELGFQGFVMSDWEAQHSGLASAEGGLDLTMPESPYWRDGNLTLSVSNGSLSQSRLDDMALRIIAPYLRYAEFEPGTGFPADLNAPHMLIDARDPASDEVIRRAAVEGHVLVKNVDRALPLRRPRFMSIFGYDAVAAAKNTPTNGMTSTKWDYGMENTQYIPGLGDFNDTYPGRLFLQNEPWNAPRPAVAYNGTLIGGGGSGGITPAFIDAPFDALQRRARADRTYLAWDFANQNPSVNGASDVCLVFINEQASEGWDRPNLADPWSDELVINVAAQCNNTQVIVHSAGIRLVDRWIHNENITAVIFAHLPGQETGQSLVDILYGDVSLQEGCLTLLPGQNQTTDNFTEGLHIDYKSFIARNVTPRFEFGFGLTYTEFHYADIDVEVASEIRACSAGESYSGENTVVQPEGGDPDLWRIVATANCTIKNVGDVAAAEVAQLYLHIPGGPARVLRGFEKVYLRPEQEKFVSFTLTQRDLSIWNVGAQHWQLQEGEYNVSIGKSVLDTQLSKVLQIYR